MLEFLVILIIFAISTALFQKAAGTLHPGKLNIVSCVYYVFLLQYFIGASMIILGFSEHYTLSYLLEREQSIKITLFVIMAISIALPFCIIIWQKVFRTDFKKDYGAFLQQETKASGEKVWSCLFAIGVAITVIVLIGFLSRVGYIPLLRLVHAPAGFDFGTERTRIGELYFIHPYISNILLFTIAPLLSYLAFAYALATKEWKWCIMSAVTFVVSVICKTYKFEKTPVLFHLMIFVLIYIYLKDAIKIRHMVILGGSLIVAIAALYLVLGFEGTFFDIYNGPLGRTFFTEVGTLAYCFDLFPSVFGFLGGRSFSPTILKLLGIGGEQYLRSAKLTMAFYGSEKVHDGTAGVMNTLFAGEAYANWGYVGVVFSVVWVALVIAGMMWIVLKLKKSPSTVVLMAIMSIRIAMILKGGFCDFVYSFDLIFTLTVLLVIYLLFESNGIHRIKGRLNNVRKNKSQNS